MAEKLRERAAYQLIRNTNKNEIKTITRIYNNYTKDFEYKITEFFVVSEPPEGAIEMSRFHLNQLMRIKENPPNRYGNK